MDIVEIEGKPFAKRGKESGRKNVFRCGKCMKGYVLPFNNKAPKCACGGKTASSMTEIISEGRIIKDLPSAREIRKRMLEELSRYAGDRDAKDVLCM
jgi:nicotinate phosphoribosyltransferase